MANRLEFEATTVLSKDPFACMCALPCPGRDRVTCGGCGGCADARRRYA
jgi:hypothetical protein